MSKSASSNYEIQKAPHFAAGCFFAEKTLTRTVIKKAEFVEKTIGLCYNKF